VRNVGHTGPSNVQVIGDIIDNGAPVHEVLGYLVRQLLAVLGVTLVRVVCNDLAVPLPEWCF
jgi:hypothetical protein